MPTTPSLWLKRFFTAQALIVLMPAAFAMDFETRVAELLSVQPLPFIFVQGTTGEMVVPFDAQRIANEMPARIKRADVDALSFDVNTLVISPVSSTKLDVLFEFKLRCTVLPSTQFETSAAGNNPIGPAIAFMVKLAQERGLKPQWGAVCFAGSESDTAVYRQIMRFPAGGVQLIATNRLVYTTNSNARLMFVF